MQKKSLTLLIQAFFENTNCVLADERGLGKKVTIVSFLSLLKFAYQVFGPFLVVTTEGRLAHWQYLFEKWTKLRVLSYKDDEEERGMANLREWAVYQPDVTLKGNLTKRH